MENASKALLIAGAILLVIAIIAIGMSIYGQAQRVVTDAGGQIDTMAVTAHNSMFDGIEDAAVIKGSKLKDLKTKIDSYNNGLSNDDYEVTITINDKAGAAVTSAGAIKSNSEYTISVVTYTNGILKSFTATEK